VKFSLIFGMPMADPTRASEAQLFRDCVAQAELADQIGYHAAWAVEHHGLYEYSHSSAPETFLAFVAARTRRIRLGHGITLTPFRYNHPLRVAERVATLDILSEGRVNWGSGKSSSLTEQAAFQCDIGSLHDEWLEALDMIPRMWKEDVFQYRGKFFEVPPTRVIPKPVQIPHPPLFAACTNPDSAVRMGELGLGALNLAVGDDNILRRKVRAYRAAVAASCPNAYQKNDHFACTPAALCLADAEKACAYGTRARFFLEGVANYYFGGERAPGPIPVHRDFLPDRGLRDTMSFPGSRDESSVNIVGDPHHCREMVSRFRDAGVDELILLMQGGTVPNELVLESIRTFGEQVMPHFP
jgi:alkanesulfonate monooxygenase SsuD/methylene tetrahydromethanopterin reductase-like flavin-dependent oxidoreductase (luciferase family)